MRGTALWSCVSMFARERTGERTERFEERGWKAGHLLDVVVRILRLMGVFSQRLSHRPHLALTDQIDAVVFLGRALWRRLLLAHGHVDEHQRALDAAVAGMAVHQRAAVPVDMRIVFVAQAVIVELAALAARLLLGALGSALAPPRVAQRAARALDRGLGREHCAWAEEKAGVTRWSAPEMVLRGCVVVDLDPKNATVLNSYRDHGRTASEAELTSTRHVDHFAPEVRESLLH
jgi:hypothetical protein